MTRNEAAVSALIGHTGFVGGNLAASATFTYTYHSGNISESRGKHFDFLVCAAARAEKWKANRDPEADERHILELVASLKQLSADRAVLISTIDVFRDPVNKVESDEADLVNNHAYGRHRALLEKEFMSIFPDARVVRLPGLFGPGLKKNVIFDFLHEHEVEKIDSRALFQFYGIRRLWPDVQRFLQTKERILHIATEPVSVQELVRRCFGMSFLNVLAAEYPVYDFRSELSSVWGRDDGYLYSREEVLQEISDFVHFYEFSR